MQNPLLVGVDIHRQQNVLCLLDRQGQQIGATQAVANNRAGSQGVGAMLAEQMTQGGFDGLRVAAEATGWYWFHWFESLRQHPALGAWPLELYAINPRLSSQYKKSMGELDKSDPIDALVVADWLRTRRRLPTPYTWDQQLLPLRFLTRYRYHVVHNLAREKAYCVAMLYLKASEYTHPDHQPFSNVFGAASRAVLQEFTSLEQIAALPFAELVEWLDGKGKRRFPDPTSNARKLVQVAQDSYLLPQPLQAPIQLILSLSLRQIADLEAQERRLNTAIAEQCASLHHTLDSIPGFGPVFSAGILAEIGDLARFDHDEAKVAKFAGLHWPRHQSASFEAEDTFLSRAGNPFLRYYFCEAANAVRMHDADYAAFYAKKFAEVRKHQHKRALVLTARKLVRLVVRLLTSRQTFRPRRSPSA